MRERSEFLNEFFYKESESLGRGEDSEFFYKQSKSKEKKIFFGEGGGGGGLVE